MEMYDREKELLDHEEKITSRISDTCRFVAFGLLAIVYTLRSGDNEFAKSVRDGNSSYVLWAIGVLAALAILADYLQYFFAHRSNAEAQDRDDMEYNPDSFATKARYRFFDLKQIMTAVAAGLLVYLVATA